MQPEEIRGERITLRHMVRADVDQMASWPRFREPDLQWANLDLSFPTDRDAYFERGRTNANRLRYVILDERQELIGTVGLRDLDYYLGEGTLGIIIRADAVGRGYGTDTLLTLARHAFEVLGLRRVLLDVAQTNDRARHVYEKLGFVHVGQHLGPQGYVYDDMVLTRDAFQRLAALPPWRST
jgi:RimJ/RimL family protein N-acetyltransferase